MRIALFQTQGSPGDVEANITAAEEAAARAKAGGADLLILPEMFLSGYAIGELAFELAESADGDSARRMAEAARRHAIAILYGHGEHGEGGHCYDAATLVDARGRHRTTYRKAHLFGDDERTVYSPGNDLGHPHGLNGLRVGVLVSYDAEFPEAVRALAAHGADLICVPAALPESRRKVAELLVPARAAENGCFVAYANRCWREHETAYAGLSTVAAPDGSVLARAGRDEDMLFANIDVPAYHRTRDASPYLDDRRPELYAAAE
ncbi:nitrilase-related carbon-nitrogen hydrolase [Caenispirillum salinarum]|uniref:nitrilase-related carbon-nitrogen hydrolase n=1 Tax=Caenispirillum salinarum TaxID=859058 RepID=UPI00384D5D50